MIRVSSLDAGMLYAETAEMPMHTMGVLILERPVEPIFERLRRVVEERLHLLAPFRRRLVEGPLQIGDPHWIEDPEFSVENHLRRTAVPSPGSMRELAELVAVSASGMLDRSRPLWELQVVEGLEGGKVAVVAKIHHAAMDGGRLVSLIGTLLDLSPEGRTLPSADDAWTPDKEPSLLWLTADAARALVTKPLHALRAATEVGASILGGVQLQSFRRDDSAKLFEAPATPLNGALSPQRSIAMADVAFDDVKAVKRAFGTTVNDVVLAAACGALRSWLRARGGLPARPLVANVPVTVRSDGDEESGNRVSMILVHLPVRVDDPVERLLAIRAETQRAKERHGEAWGRRVSAGHRSTHEHHRTVGAHARDRGLRSQPPRRSTAVSVEPRGLEPAGPSGAALLRRRQASSPVSVRSRPTGLGFEPHRDERGGSAVPGRARLQAYGPRRR